MAEITYLWDGTATGDATEAPYDKISFNKYMYLPSITDNSPNEAFIIPEVGQELEVLKIGVLSTLSMVVRPGAAIIGGNYIYISDEDVTLSIDGVTDNTYFRYDLVVLRLDINAQTVRLAVLKGEEVNSVSNIELPTPIYTADIKEIPIARVFVNSTITIHDYFVHDLRQFATNVLGSRLNKLVDTNLVINNEFMAFSSSDGSTPPEGWDMDSSASTTFSAYSKPSVMSRGQAIKFGAADTLHTIEQYIKTNREDDIVIGLYPTGVYTVKGVFVDVDGSDPGSNTYVDVSIFKTRGNGDVKTSGSIIYNRDGGVGITQRFPSGAAGEVITFQFTVRLSRTGNADGMLLRVSKYGGEVALGQVIIVPGHHPGPFREFRETIIFRERLDNASWSDTAKSTGTTTLDLTTFGVLDKTMGAFIRTRGRDSASAAGVASIQLQGYAAPYNTVYGRLELDGVTNDVYRENTFYVPVGIPITDAQDETPQCRVGVTATGAGTFDATLEIVGIVT